MKQSSIEWFIEEIRNEMRYGKDLSTRDRMFYEDIMEEAKAMHKEEILNAWDAGYDEIDRATASPIKYYHETFNTEKK